MKFDPHTMELFTDDGQFLKKLRCPLRMKWSELRSNPVNSHRMCGECERQVLNTDGMSDAEISAEIRVDPDTCVAISARQENVSIVHWSKDAALPGDPLH